MSSRLRSFDMLYVKYLSLFEAVGTESDVSLSMESRLLIYVSVLEAYRDITRDALTSRSSRSTVVRLSPETKILPWASILTEPLLFPARQDDIRPIILLAHGESWGIDECCGRTSVVRTPRVNFMLSGQDFVPAFNSSSVDVSITISRSRIAHSFTSSINFRNGQRLGIRQPSRAYP